MNSESHDAERIFAEARRLSVAAEREAYLARACAGNQGLRQEVETLLRAHEQAGDFLDRTVTLSEPDFVIERLLVSHIGPASDAVAAVFRGLGLHAESLPAPDGDLSLGPELWQVAGGRLFGLRALLEREGWLSLTLPFNGGPINTEALDNFAFEVKARFQRRRALDLDRSLETH